MSRYQPSSNTFLSALRGACRLFGGIRAVADKCGVDSSALGKWLKGAPTLAPEKVKAVLRELRLPDGEPTTSGDVITWSFTVYWDDIQDAMKIYFPDGAEMVRTPWSMPGMGLRARILRRFESAADDPPEIYLFRDGRTRAALLLPSGLLLPEAHFGPWLRPRTGDCRFRVCPDRAAWIAGRITPEMFDRAFASRHVGWEDLIEHAHLNDLDAGEVLERLVHEAPPPAPEGR